MENWVERVLRQISATGDNRGFTLLITRDNDGYFLVQLDFPLHHTFNCARITKRLPRLL